MKKSMQTGLKGGQSVLCGSGDKTSSTEVQGGESWWPCDEQGLCWPSVQGMLSERQRGPGKSVNAL